MMISFMNLYSQPELHCQKTTHFWQKGRYVIKGNLTINELKNNPETNFWFNPNYDSASSNPELVQLLQKNKDLKWIIFIGTWCGDTRAIFPEFAKNFDEAKLPWDQVQIIGVDRNKKTCKKLHTTYKIAKVPTFILYRNNQEVSRIEEYGKEEQFASSLISILKH